MKKAAVLMGSDSDFPIVKKGVALLEQLGIPFEVHVYSAHRTPELVKHFSETAIANGFGVIIAAAGKAAHLAGVVAAHSTLPVIGLPISATQLDGLDALLSTVQMPSGIPVATVAINGAENAALLAGQILATGDEKLFEIMVQHRRGIQQKAENAEATFQARLKQELEII